MTRASHDDVRRSSLPDWSLVNRVLLIRLRSIGDTVLMTPCLAALKTWLPHVEISVLLEPLSAPLLEDHPQVDRLIEAGPDLSARARLALDLRASRFDVAFNVHGGTTGMMMARLCAARHTVAFGGHRQSWLVSAPAPGPDEILGRARIHSVEQQLALLHWAGVPWPSARPALSLSLSAEAQANVHKRLERVGLSEANCSRRFALIAPSAAMESKRWTEAGFAQAADHLYEKWGLPSVVIAGPGQENIARQVSALARSRPTVISGLSLKELMALIEASTLFVGNDSGPAHIAAAFARPMVVVFGSSNLDVWRPWTRSVYKTVGGEGPDHKQRIKRITAGEVTAAADETLEAALRAGHSADTGSASRLKL